LLAVNVTSVALPQADGQRRQSGFDVLRIGAIFGVIAIHVFSGLVSNPAVRGSGSWWLAVFADIGFIWAVPVFVMVSGALLLRPTGHLDGPAAFYRKRLARLGWAFVFWQVFYIVVVRIGMSHEQLSARKIAAIVFSGNTYTHLYFLWLIVGLYLVAPILVVFLADGGPRRARWFAAVTMATTTCAYMASSVLGHFGVPAALPLMAFTQWLPYVGYFLAGWALRDVRLGGRSLWLGLAGTCVVIVANVLLYAQPQAVPLLSAVLPVNYLGPLVMLSAVGVFVVVNSVMDRVSVPVVAGRALGVVSDAVFGVYLCHFFLLLLADRLSTTLSQRTEYWWAAIAMFAAVTVVSFSVSIALRRVPYLRRLF
jgi:surface polysaccharide O-acyltransferase-like enzyme